MLAGAEADYHQVSLDDIVLLSQRGVSDQTILLFLENREAGFSPDADAIDRLLLAGVSDEIIQYLLSQATTVQTSPDVVPPETYTNAVPNYPVTTYPASPVYPAVTYVNTYPVYYYTPYYYGGPYSFGFVSYPHTWFGHHSGVGHHRVNAHHVTHTGRHSGTQTVSAIHTVQGGRHGSVHSDNKYIGHNRQHASATGGQHGVSRGDQTANHGALNIGHGGTHVTARSSHSGGQSHVGRSGGSHSGGHGGGH